jgi:ATP-dependent DNA helicase RecG
MQTDFLDTPLSYLKTVGPQRALSLKAELHLSDFRDLLYYFPFRYVDRSKFYKVNEIDPEMPYVQIKGRITRFSTAGSGRSQRLIADFRDETGSVELIWFQGAQWVKNSIKPGLEYVLQGRPTAFNGVINIPHPDLELLSMYEAAPEASLQPVYNSTEKLKTKGLDSKGIYKLIKILFAQLEPMLLSREGEHILDENLSSELVSDLRLLSHRNAVYQIHFPKNLDLLKKAEFRLKFEDLFFPQIRMLSAKNNRTQTVRGHVFSTVGEYFNSFYRDKLPFELTNAQKRVIKEIRADMGSGKQMNRLLQGDVGSGKTLVALMCMLISMDNGYQSALMVPTEILAIQHYKSISELVEGLGISVKLLTGSTKTKERREIMEHLIDGRLHILIGTHALIEDDVKFQNLGFVVIDEQHRFGVEQRSKLWNKNTILPHVLIMTATPIPRTLAMTIYGDLDTSIIDEMPPGRKPIHTKHYFDSARLRLFGFMKEQIKLGRQIYVVYPLIEESEKMDYKDLMDGYESILRAFPRPAYQVSIVHGRMASQDKDFEMQRFVRGETQIMVATTVIEVGVNVPNASVMVIESAERFGLSQLHQLRGRVGRGAEQSFCIMMSSYKLSAEAKVRMDTMVRTNDGFEIADTDLKLRGPGDMAGTRQSGMEGMKIADLVKDSQILQLARASAIRVLAEDANLSSEMNKPIVKFLRELSKEKTNWSRIS